MAFEKLKQQGQAPLMPTMSHNPVSAPAIPGRKPGTVEQLATGAASTAANSVAKNAATSLFAKAAAPVAAEAVAAPLVAGAAAPAAAAATGAAGAGAAGTGLMAAAMTNPITAPLAIGAALFGGKKMMGK